MSFPHGVCSECHGYGGHHMNGCPEGYDPDDDEEAGDGIDEEVDEEVEDDFWDKVEEDYKNKRTKAEL
jgi:mono/diheme cytochrome c family protein